jgi:acylphosphatase
MALARSRLRVEGLVQGVGFRAAAAQTARRLHLSGFVRNLPDGCVEAAVEGDPADVAAFVR